MILRIVGISRPLQLATVLLLVGIPFASQAPAAPAAAPPYEHRSDHDPDGTGKFYLDREIAQVMGYAGADWLERGERARQERPDLLLAALELKPGQVVADIGAGSGYYTRRLAKAVGTEGRVYAVDLQPEMLEILGRNLTAEGLENVELKQGRTTSVGLPAATLDLALLVDVYHEFEFPYEMMRSICQALKPGGRVVLVEFRAEDPKVPIKAVHKMSEAQVRREMAAHPLRWIKTINILPWQHAVVFERMIDAPSHHASKT